MQKCESCNTTFEPQDGLAEVTSLRILCPECQARRRAEKARRAAAKPGAPAGPVELPPETETVRRPAPQATAAPTAAKAPAAKGTAAAQARKRLAEAEETRRQRAEHVQEVGRTMKKKGSREIVVGFLGAFLILAVAGVLGWRVLGKKRAEADAEKARVATIEAFRTEFAGFDIATVKGAQDLIAFAEQKKTFWKDSDLEGDVISRTAKAKTLIETEGEKATISERFKDIQAGLAKGAELPPSDLADLRRRLDELTPKAPLLGTDFVAELATARDTAEAAHVASLYASAEKAAATEPLDRAALAVIQQAEDEIFKIFENAYRLWQKDPKEPVILARKEEFEDRYKGVIKLSDDAVEKFFTPAAIDAIPWRDLLSPAETSHWKAAALKGFEFRVENGLLHMIGPSPEEKSEGIASIGDKEVWRDFVIDCEFTIVRGRFNFFFRLPLVWQENVESYELTTDEGNLTAGRAYEYAFKVIGSTYWDEQLGADSLGANPNTIQWTRVRKGALGLAVPKDTEVKFTRLRVKILR